MLTYFMSVGLSFRCWCWCMLHQFLQYFQWRGQVVYKVLHAAWAWIELQVWHLSCSRSSVPSGCWQSTGTHTDTRLPSKNSITETWFSNWYQEHPLLVPNWGTPLDLYQLFLLWTPYPTYS